MNVTTKEAKGQQREVLLDGVSVGFVHTSDGKGDPFVLTGTPDLEEKKRIKKAVVKELGLKFKVPE